MFDKELFLKIVQEAEAEIIDGHGNDIVNDVEVDTMSILFECGDFINKEVEE